MINVKVGCTPGVLFVGFTGREHVGGRKWALHNSSEESFEFRSKLGPAAAGDDT